MEKLPRKILADDKLLAKFTVFAELSEEELHTLIEQSATESYSAGVRIINAGDSGHCMYVILNGSVSVSVKRGNGDIELARLSAGDFFGEVALVDDGPHGAGSQNVALGGDDGLRRDYFHSRPGVFGPQ